MTTNRARAAVFAALLLAAAAGADAAEEKKLGWAHIAELGYVATSGNSETSTISFKDASTYTWQNALLILKAGGLRTEATTPRRIAVSQVDPADPNFVPSRDIDIEDGDSETTAENYYANARYDHEISPHFFWNVGGGWERNEIAGIQNRYLGYAGLGNIWRDDARVKFRTTYGATYTNQKDVVENPDFSDSFLGFRAAWDYVIKFGESTTYANIFIFDENLDETDDWRADMVNSVAVSMSKRLALKVSLQTLYDNLPSLEEIPVEYPAGVDSGRKVQNELDEFDAIFTTALVMTF